MPATSYRFKHGGTVTGSGMLASGAGLGPDCLNEETSDGDTTCIVTGAINPSFECALVANPNSIPTGGITPIPIANLTGMVLRIAARRMIVGAVGFNYTLKNQIGTTVKTGTLALNADYVDVATTPNGYWEIALSPAECALLSNSNIYTGAILRFDTFTGLHLFVNDEARIAWAELSVPLVLGDCRVLRIDVENLNGIHGFNWMGCATPVFDVDAGKLYFAYTCASAVDGATGAENHSTSAYFRVFDIETETFDALPVRITGKLTDPTITLNGSCDSLGMVRDHTGRFYVFYGESTECAGCYSDDGGTTWTGPFYVSPSVSFRGYLACTASPTGDIFVWTHQFAGGGGVHDTWLYKRDFSTGLWTLVGLFDDGDVSAGIQPSTPLNQAESIIMDADGLTGLAVFSRLESTSLGSNTASITAYRTTDAWVTVVPVFIKTWNPYIQPVHPILRRGVVDTDRFWLMWIESDVPYFAYSDDWGLTWTQLGTPASMATYGWDEAYDRGFFIDFEDTQYSSVFGVAPATTLNMHTAWKNEDPEDTGAWTSENCNLDDVSIWNDAGSTVGQAFYYSRADRTTRFYRVFNRAWPSVTVAGAYFLRTYDLFILSGFTPDIPEEVIPEVPLPDARRMFRRGVLQAQGVNIPQRRANATASIERAVRPPGVD